MTAAQFEDPDGRALVEAIHQRQILLAQPLPTQPTYRGPEWETHTDMDRADQLEAGQ